jgi:hypothetical protein
MGCLEGFGNLGDGARGGPESAPSNHKRTLAAFRPWKCMWLCSVNTFHRGTPCLIISSCSYLGTEIVCHSMKARHRDLY